MKNKILLLFVLLFYGCSFDNKSGIWKNENSTTEDTIDSFREFKRLAITSYSFNKIINPKKNLTLKTPPSFDKGLL